MNGNKEIVSFEELLLAVNYTQDALIMLLDKKGIVSQAEVLKEIKKMRESEGERRGQGIDSHAISYQNNSCK